MFRRGFKTWAEEAALRVRKKLELPVASPLNPFQLAKLLSVTVLAPQDLIDLPDDLRTRLVSDHRDSWSAITVTDGHVHLIVINPSHAPSRTNSNLAHELAHLILDHEPSMMFLSPNSGSAIRTHNPLQEEEANWLAGCLLLPRQALLSIRRRRLTDERACAEYGVSPGMLRFRLSATGVDIQLSHARRTKR